MRISSLLMGGLLLCGTGGVFAQDQALYKVMPLLPREQEEVHAKEKWLAEAKGEVFKPSQPESKATLTLDFSQIDKPASSKAFLSHWHFPPKRQWWTNCCWCFAGTSFLESEIKRLSGREIKLSEMFTVYWEYVEKAREYVKSKGTSLFAEGGQTEGVLVRAKQYGMVPASAYTGLPTGQTVYNHELLIEELQQYLHYVKTTHAWHEATVLRCVRCILDKHLGEPPENITVEGRLLTPKAYLKDVLKLNPSDYATFTSFKKQAFWTQGEYPVPDNWWHSKTYHNVPLDDFYGALPKALQAGYTVAIAGDVTEPGYSGADDCAIIPTFDCPPSAINQDSREFRFYNKSSEDDHCLHMVGYTRKGDRDWFLIKDSSRSGQRGEPGYFFYRDDYVKLKMLTFMVHKDAVQALLARFK